MPSKDRNSAFSKYQPKGQAQSGTARPSAPKPRREPDACPDGYDPDVWHLALLFRQCAQADKIELPKGLPVIHAELADVVDRYKVRGQKYLQEVYGCHRREMPDDMAARCWYHWPPERARLAEQEARELTWVQFMEVVMAEFWSRIWDEHALDGFRQYFAEYANGAWQHWKHLRIAAAVPAAHHPGYLTRHGHARMPAEARRDA